MNTSNDKLSNVPIVLGPGHSLNELVSNLLWTCHSNTLQDTTGWELYPGVFGLYARHCDDWVAMVDVNTRTIDLETHAYYNDVVRCSTDPKIINDFFNKRKDVFYTNLPYEDLEPIIGDIEQPVVCTYLDMENNPESRFHFAMMEFSDGAADQIDYNNVPSFEDVALRCRIKHEVESNYRERLTSIIWVDVGKILKKDYTDLYPIIGNDRFNHLLDQVVDKIHWYNRIAHPTIQKLVNADWQEITEILVDND